jgi:uncharacterized protein
MINREAEPQLRKLAKQFKAVAVVGPRQSGKTTLTKHIFGGKPYVNLENPDNRQFAQNDPRGFFAQYNNGAVIDEAQRAPELFSYLQQVLDEEPGKGKFILTGSNNFLLQENISQSLAGRIAYIYLLPFTLSELSETKTGNIYYKMLKGSYPPVYDQNIDWDIWYSNYIRTYLERDVRQIKNISNLYLFERFLRLCAGRCGQLLNMSNLAIETGVDNKTISSWLGLLESSFITFRLLPHHRNFNKRIVKMPKLYFYDTGLACNLLGIFKQEQLDHHPLFGALFENLVVSEMKKHCFNRGINDNLFFWRDNVGHEVDVLIDNGTDLIPVEIKSGRTITNEFFSGLEYWKRLGKTQRGFVVYAGENVQNQSNGITTVPLSSLNTLF